MQVVDEENLQGSDAPGLHLLELGLAYFLVALDDHFPGSRVHHVVR